uniref:B-cell linker protein-like n=1 Tax=Myxine glutinosa TaxID=7769 RepID=UPI00358F5862
MNTNYNQNQGSNMAEPEAWPEGEFEDDSPEDNSDGDYSDPDASYEPPPTEPHAWPPRPYLIAQEGEYIDKVVNSASKWSKPPEIPRCSKPTPAGDDGDYVIPSVETQSRSPKPPPKGDVSFKAHTPKAPFPRPQPMRPAIERGFGGSKTTNALQNNPPLPPSSQRSAKLSKKKSSLPQPPLPQQKPSSYPLGERPTQPPPICHRLTKIKPKLVDEELDGSGSDYEVPDKNDQPEEKQRPVYPKPNVRPKMGGQKQDIPPPVIARSPSSLQQRSTTLRSTKKFLEDTTDCPKLSAFNQDQIGGRNSNTLPRAEKPQAPLPFLSTSASFTSKSQSQSATPPRSPFSTTDKFQNLDESRPHSEKNASFRRTSGEHIHGGAMLPLVPERRVSKPSITPRFKINKCDRTAAETAVRAQNMDGAYLIRESSKQQSHQPYTLVVYYENKVYNVHIRHLESERKYALGTEKPGEDKFDSVEFMMEHYRKFPLLLVGGQFGIKKSTLLKFQVNV